MPAKEVPLNTHFAVDYSAILLSHAEILRLSSRINWASLHGRSLYWLIRLLARFKVFRERTRDIVTLLRFVFEEADAWRTYKWSYSIM